MTWLTVTARLVGLHGSDRIFQNLAVVTVDDLAHILQALVTHLDVVLVDQFGERIVLWKCFNNSHKLLPDLCLHTCAEWRIEPGDISRPRPVPARSRTVIYIRWLEL